MKSKATIPADQQVAVTVFVAARKAQGFRLTRAQAYVQMQAIEKMEALRKAAEQTEAQAKRKADRAALFNGEVSGELDKYAALLAGVSAILTEIISGAENPEDMAGVARDVVDRANAYISNIGLKLGK